MGKDEKFHRNHRGDGKPRLFSSHFFASVFKTPLQDLSIVGVVCVGTLVWAGSEKLADKLDSRISSSTAIGTINERLNGENGVIQRLHDLSTTTDHLDKELSKHDERLRTLEKK